MFSLKKNHCNKFNIMLRFELNKYADFKYTEQIYFKSEMTNSPETLQAYIKNVYWKLWSCRQVATMYFTGIQVWWTNENAMVPCNLNICVNYKTSPTSPVQVVIFCAAPPPPKKKKINKYMAYRCHLFFCWLRPLLLTWINFNSGIFN